MALLEHKLREAEAARVELEQTRARLEREVRLKELSLEIDQTKCLTLRSEQCQGRDSGVRRVFKIDLAKFSPTGSHQGYLWDLQTCYYETFSVHIKMEFTY